MLSFKDKDKMLYVSPLALLPFPRPLLPLLLPRFH